MKKLLICQNYNANKGDSSVITAIVESLGSIDAIKLTSYNTEQAAKEYGLEAAEWLLSFYKIKNSKSKFLKCFYYTREFFWLVYLPVWILFYNITIKLPVPGFKRRTIEYYLDSDVVILPGGHFFTNLNNFPVVFSHFVALYFAKLIGKKTMIYAQTIGDFFGSFGYITKKLTHSLIKHTDKVTLREGACLKNCPKTKNISVTNEVVFLSEIKEMQEVVAIVDKYIRNRPVVAVTIHHIYYKHFFTKNVYVNLMAAIFEMISKDYGFDILIIPMESNIHQGGDRPLAREIIARSNSDKIQVIEEDLSPSTTANLISKSDFFIGTKTHSIVYGLKSAVPTFSISYQEKSNQFMKSFDVLENAINLKDLNLREFSAKFSLLVEKRNFYSKKQLAMLQEVRLQAKENNEILLSLFN